LGYCRDCRNILEVGSGFSEHAAQAIVALEYDRSAQLALHDDSELVRYVAVRQLEKQEHSSILIESLKSTSFRVRQIAAWYMGRKLVKEAVMPLIELSQVETDEETLRAVVWSLGVLRDKRAIPYLHLLRHHKSSLIASSVETALANFSK
jgi:HEAT repeat protein